MMMRGCNDTVNDTLSAHVCHEVFFSDLVKPTQIKLKRGLCWRQCRSALGFSSCYDRDLFYAIVIKLYTCNLMTISVD